MGSHNREGPVPGLHQMVFEDGGDAEKSTPRISMVNEKSAGKGDPSQAYGTLSVMSGVGGH